MVTRETSYIGQLYFGLSTDDPADVAEWHNGDRILLMDVNKMYVYDEAAVTFHEIPMGGGGGGGGGLQGFDVLASGEYVLASDQTTPLTIPVDLPNVQINMASITLTDLITSPNSTMAGIRFWHYMDYFPPIPSYVTTLAEFVYTSGNGSKSYTTLSNTTEYPITYLGSPNVTAIILQKAQSSGYIRAGTYKWIVRGAHL